MPLAQRSPTLRTQGTLRCRAALARLALSFAVAAGAIALPAHTASAGGGIAIQLLQIIATEPGPGPKEFRDPALDELKTQLEKYSYRVFSKAALEKKEVAEGATTTFGLAREPGFKLDVTARAAAGHVSLDLSMRDPKDKVVLATRLKLKDGGTGIVGKELESKDGHLFLAFTVKRS